MHSFIQLVCDQNSSNIIGIRIATVFAHIFHNKWSWRVFGGTSSGLLRAVLGTKAHKIPWFDILFEHMFGIGSCFWVDWFCKFLELSPAMFGKTKASVALICTASGYNFFDNLRNLWKGQTFHTSRRLHNVSGTVGGLQRLHTKKCHPPNHSPRLEVRKLVCADCDRAGTMHPVQELTPFCMYSMCSVYSENIMYWTDSAYSMRSIDLLHVLHVLETYLM